MKMKNYSFIGMYAEAGDVEKLDEYEKAGRIAEAKLDGIRYILYITEDGEAHLVSRNQLDNAKKYPFLDDEHIPVQLKDCIFDGEMVVQSDFTHWRNSLSGIQSINGSAVERARLLCHENSDEVRFVIFDVLRFQGRSTEEDPYTSRRALLAKLFMQETFPKWFRLAKKSEKIQELYDEVVAGGGEGIMVKDPDAPYMPSRGTAWLKIKHVEFSEGVIVASTPGDGRNKGLVGSVIVRGEESGKKFQGCFGSMTDVFRREITGEDGKIKKEWIGRRVRVKYYPGGVYALRHCQLVKVFDEGGQK